MTKPRPTYAYRLTAYSPGGQVAYRRTYLTKRAAERKAQQRLAGYCDPLVEDAGYIDLPASRVTIEESERVIFGSPRVVEPTEEAAQQRDALLEDWGPL